MVDNRAEQGSGEFWLQDQNIEILSGRHSEVFGQISSEDQFDRL